jgi:hypothetical protein
MAKLNLQTLVLRAASLAGARATILGSKGFAVMGNPAWVQSFSSHPLPGLNPTGLEPVEDHRGYSMDTLDGRAGRSAGSAGVSRHLGIARKSERTILSDWSRTGGSTGNPAVGCAGGPSRFETTPASTGDRLVRCTRVEVVTPQRPRHTASLETVAKRVGG